MLDRKVGFGRACGERLWGQQGEGGWSDMGKFQASDYAGKSFGSDCNDKYIPPSFLVGTGNKSRG